MPLSEFVPGQVWLQEYPIHFAGCDFDGRMAVIRVSATELMIHSPCEIDSATRDAISALGDVAYIVAPGSYHHIHIPSAQAAFPEADSYICPGIERKRPDLDFDWFLGDRPPTAWAGVLDQVLVRGNKFIWEVVFFHKPSKTLLVVDLIENFTDQTPNVNWLLKLWWKVVFHMWDNPKPAPEYQMGWKDKTAARESLQRILEWDFDKIVLSHGDLIETNAKSMAQEAWEKPLSVS
ncbi:MAG: DUF4336 domain-containing protein [Gammaproteobacteria bacterium]|nr:DUF4336 domain-containing protein [Gammaproteobacteria bacterium]NNL51774.1 DUF4336 domain-containing protein [Woeseiaceae bacterium]